MHCIVASRLIDASSINYMFFLEERLILSFQGVIAEF